MNHPVGILPFLFTGCMSDRAILDPVAEAWGRRVVEEATPAVAAALGMTAVAAALCPYSLAEWQGMDDTAPTLPDDVAAWFGVEPVGVLESYPARGQFSCSWTGGTVFGEQVALHADVATPMTSFTVALTEPREGGDTGPDETGLDTGERETLASMALATSGCGSEVRRATGRASFPVSGGLGWGVELASAEGESGVGYAPDAGLPSSGGLVWTGIADVGRSTLTTHDAASIADGSWPATASGRGWSAEVALPLP